VTSPTAGVVPATSWHDAVFYRGDAEYAHEVGGFVRRELAAGRRVLCALPPDRERVLREVVDADGFGVRILDMTEIGRNPNCIIPEIQAFLDVVDGPVSCVGEPIWAGRTRSEVAEATRYEALVNLAFDGKPLRVLCPYDAAGLESSVLDDVWRTHPTVQHDLVSRPSVRYADPEEVWRTVVHLPAPPVGTVEVELDLRGLARFRPMLADHARAAGLPEERARDLLVVAGELVTNAVRHGHGRLRAWHSPGSVVVEVRDRGLVTDPLAGRLKPEDDELGGWSLWLVNQLCDLVQLHADDLGTTTRIHVRG
jgi:anti-sigma regulatory factor (Ser/Thr protein kinase)